MIKRSNDEMMQLILEFPKSNDGVIAILLEGSLANDELKKDNYEDYDITYVVEDDCYDNYIKDKSFLDYFGPRMMIKEPLDMELFNFESLGYSYLIYFEDKNKIDLTIMPKSKVDEYKEKIDIFKVLYDKENLFDSDKLNYEVCHVNKPSEKEFLDSSNEFWFVSGLVSKGLMRGEMLYAIHYLEALRWELMRNMSWLVGARKGFGYIVGKKFKYLNKFLDEKTWVKFISTYYTTDMHRAWAALIMVEDLFMDTTKDLSKKLGFKFPDYAKKMYDYTSDEYVNWISNDAK